MMEPGVNLRETKHSDRDGSIRVGTQAKAVLEIVVIIEFVAWPHVLPVRRDRGGCRPSSMPSSHAPYLPK